MIRAELSGSDRASALGIDAQAPAAVLALCRKLVEAGHDPAEPLEAYRGDVMCLRVRSIGEVARLQVNRLGTGFVWDSRQDDDSAPPVRFKGDALAGHPTNAKPLQAAA
jgi:hypothetical protein